MPKSDSLADAGLLAARLLLALIFLHEGVSLLVTFPEAAAAVAKLGVPAPLLAATIALQIVCGAAIATGLYTRLAAILLAAFCVATAGLFHTRLSIQNELLHFEKDLAIAGGMLALAVAGSGRFAIEQARSSARPHARPTTGA